MRTPGLMIGIFAGALVLGTPAVAAGSKVATNNLAGAQSAASKLSLAGAQGAGQNDCVSRAGQDGVWRVDASGNWVRCKRAGPGKANAPGQAWLIVGAVGALGIGLGLGLSHKGPSSP